MGCLLSDDLFSIGRTTVRGLNFDPHFFQLCYRTQALKKKKRVLWRIIEHLISEKVLRDGSRSQNGSFSPFCFKIAQKVF